MKTLTNYTKNGSDFALVERVGNLAVFEGVPKSGASPTFELIEIQSHNGRELHGTFYEPAEYPPSNEQWGAKGWTYQTKEEAMGAMAAKAYSLTPTATTGDIFS